MTAALSVCGQRLSRVMFCGFLPAKDADRRKTLQELTGESATLVFYEAPHRVIKTIEAMVKILGADGRVALCRELTKLYEETHVCALGEARAWLESMPERVRGEFVLVVNRGEAVKEAGADEGERVLALLMPELPLKRAVALAAEISGGRKNALYRRALELAGDADAQ